MPKPGSSFDFSCKNCLVQQTFIRLISYSQSWFQSVTLQFLNRYDLLCVFFHHDMPYFILLKKRDYARLRHYIHKCVYMNTWELTVYHKRENRCRGERWMNRLDLPSSSWTMQIDQNHRIVCKDTKTFIESEAAF